MKNDWISGLGDMLREQAERSQIKDEEFFLKYPPKKEIEMNEVTYGIFDVENFIFYAQKYSNGYHIRNLIRMEDLLILTINEVIQMRES